MNPYTKSPPEELFHIHRKISDAIYAKNGVINSGIDSFMRLVLEDEIAVHRQNLKLLIQELKNRDLLKHIEFKEDEQ